MKVSNLIKCSDENKNWRSIIILFLALTVVFTVSFKMIFTVHYTELQGTNSWLSASTIKFVNNWLEKDPLILSFVNYESPASIEFNNVTERGPYISYPSGCTLFVYIFAKLFGKTAIDISFLKHFQMICFWIEVLLFGLFIYRFLERNNVKSELERTIAAFASASLWFLLPTNVWYLANVYFSDQCIILFVMVFLVIEYEYLFAEKATTKRLLNGIRAFTIFCGILIDYYFWIMSFVAFVLEIVYYVRNHNRERALCCILWYALPTLLAIAFYMYQLMSIPNWLTILEYKFLVRTGVEQIDLGDGNYTTFNWILRALIYNYIYALGIGSNMNLGIYLLYLLVITHIVTLNHILEPFKKAKNYIKDPVFQRNILVLIIGFISPILQVILLSSHSAIHEFSMIKLSWCAAILPIVLSLIFSNFLDFSNWSHNSEGKKYSSFFHSFIIIFIFVLIITNIPFSSRAFNLSRFTSDHHNYVLANILHSNTSYEHVCFSFTEDIPENPPHELSVSKKRVYKINNLSDIKSMFPNLSSKAVRILVINKNKSKEISSDQEEQVAKLLSSNKPYFDDESYALVKIP